jgi:hypothetical protein
MDHPHELPDGRIPLRYDTGRAAFYIKARGEGITRYTFSMIKYIQTHRRRKSPEELSRIRKAQAAKLRQADPNYYPKLARLGGKVTKQQRESKHERHQES